MKPHQQFLLDTDTCIYLLNGNQQVKDHVAQVGLISLAVSIISVGELYFGAYNSAHVEKNIARIRAFLSPPGPAILSLSTTAVESFCKYKAELYSSGLPIGDMDLLIAGIAKEHDLTVVTNNQAHFQRIPDITIDNWV